MANIQIVVLSLIVFNGPISILSCCPLLDVISLYISSEIKDHMRFIERASASSVQAQLDCYGMSKLIC